MFKLVHAVLPLALLLGGTTEESAAAPPKPAPAPVASVATRVEISVTERGFEPDNIAVAAGKPVTLVFLRKTDHTCAKEVVVTLDATTRIKKPLPLATPVEIVATFPKAGKLTYACGMDMISGTITVN